MFTDTEMDEIRRVRRLRSGYCAACNDMVAMDALLELENPLTEEDAYELLEASYEMDEMISETLFDNEY